MKGAFFWDYSTYFYTGLGITEYTEFQLLKSGNRITAERTEGGDLRTTMSAHANGHVGFPAKDFPKERVFSSFRVNRIPSILFILLSGAE